jgi:hypothetical protein
MFLSNNSLVNNLKDKEFLDTLYIPLYLRHEACTQTSTKSPHETKDMVFLFILSPFSHKISADIYFSGTHQEHNQST